MLTVVTYLWGTVHYKPAHVQLLARSVKRWLSVPHRFVCITDDAVPDVNTMRNPAPQFPGRCYRRLWLFSPEARALGDAILHLDLDLVVCGPIDAFVRDVAFQPYRAGSIAARGYSLNPSVMWLKTGTQTDIWQRFMADPPAVAAAANKAGFWGSDQAVISHARLNADVPTFGDEDGLVSFRRIRHEHLTEPPAGTRIVSFHGKRSPWERDIMRQHRWIKRAWKEAA